MPIHDCNLAIRGAHSARDMSTSGIESTGNLERKVVIIGDLIAEEKPISSNIAAALPSCER
jgi:hypothetical protein